MDSLINKVVKRINNNRKTQEGNIISNKEICSIIQNEAKVEERQKDEMREKLTKQANKLMSTITKKRNSSIKSLKNNDKNK